MHNTVLSQHIVNVIVISVIYVFLILLIRKMGLSIIKASFLSMVYLCNSVMILGSITGGTRMFLALCSIILTYFAYLIIFEEKKLLLILFGAVFAFFIGFRQDLSFYFLPLFILLIIKVKDLRIILFSITSFVLICLTWFIPLMIEYGGIIQYIQTMKNHDCVYNTSILFSGFKISPILNIFRIFVYIFNTILIIIPILTIIIIRQKKIGNKNFNILIIFAVVPAFIFQSLFHNGNFVQLAAFIPPVFIFLFYYFKPTNIKRILIYIFITVFMLSQFYFVKMIDNPKHLPAKVANVIWLQYTYDGVLSNHTLSLSGIDRESKDISK